MKLVTRFVRLFSQPLPARCSNHLLIWPLLALFSACSTLEPVEQNKNTKTVAEPAIQQTPADPQPVPGEGLTEDLLYDLLLSHIAFQQGEVNIAAEALIQAAQTTQDADVTARAARMAVHTKYYDQAVTLGLRWIDLVPGDYQAYLITALAAAMNEQGDVALSVLNALLDQDPEKSTLRFAQLGEVFLQHASGETAMDVVSQLAIEHADATEAWLLVAGMAQNEERFEMMNLALDKILLLEPGNQRAAIYKLLAQNSDAAAQLNFADKFLRDHPDAHTFRMQYAQLLLRMENNDMALKQLLALLENDPENSEAMNMIALLYQAQEDYDQSARYFIQRIKARPDDDRSRLYLANAYQQLERFDQAKITLGEINDPKELFNAGRQLSLVIEQADGAEAALEYLQSLSGDNEAQRVQLTIDRELMLQRAGRNEEAYALLNNALEQYPDNETLRYHRALITVEREDLESHEADMRILLSRKPGNPHYNNTLGYTLLVMSDRLSEAAELINKAHELKPEDPYILDSKGWLEYKLDNLDSALLYLYKAFSLDRDAEIAAHIGEVYWAQGHEDKALEYWGEGDRIDPNNKSLQEIKARFLN